MKRSEMVEAIKGDLARMDLDYLHGRNLDKTTYHERVEMLTGYFLFFAERYGMLPPETNLKDCEDPELQVYVDNVDIPHWVVLGWDNE